MTIQTSILLFGVLLLWAVAWRLPTLKARQAILLLASYAFYAHWGMGFLLVLIAGSLMNYALGAVLRRRLTAGVLWIGVALNLLLLSFFKYLPPLLETGALGSWQSHALAQIAMPIGISFWIFQALSYLFDIYREEELDPSLLEFCLYMAFWPTVFSGPVCRLPNMLPQFRQATRFTWDNISAGAVRVIQGLTMKFVLAQILASGLSPGEGVTAGFDRMDGGWGGIDVWLLAIGFGFQLFFDFAGYSHIVIGAARIFGIRLEENFDRPYFSATPSAFWTRWHMSLSFWIRDYVFLPLAALRRERAWPYLALIFSMTLFGLWHGAKLTFIVWGIYHGLLLVAHRLGQQMKRRLSFDGPPHLGPSLSWAATFAFVSLGWIFFRANDLDQAFTMLRSVLLPSHYHRLAMPLNFYIVTGLVLAGYFIFATLAPFLVHWRLRYSQKLMNNMQGTVQPLPGLRGFSVMAVELLAGKMWWWVTPIAVMLLGLGGLAIFAGSPATAFIYTRF